MKKYFALILMLSAFTVFSPSQAMAEHEGHGGGKQCSMGHKDCDGKDCDSCESQCPIQSKILKKAGFFLKNQKEIGLSDEQAAQIKAIKTETKKAGIRAEAEMKIFEMDLKEKLSQPTVDVEGLNGMIDQATAGWGTSAKAAIADYAKLKAVLNEQQMAKAKEIWTRDDDKK